MIQIENTPLQQTRPAFSGGRLAKKIKGKPGKRREVPDRKKGEVGFEHRLYVAPHVYTTSVLIIVDNNNKKAGEKGDADAWRLLNRLILRAQSGKPVPIPKIIGQPNTPKQMQGKAAVTALQAIQDDLRQKIIRGIPELAAPKAPQKAAPQPRVAAPKATQAAPAPFYIRLFRWILPQRTPTHS